MVAAHREQPIRGGTEEMIGQLAEARSAIAPEGQVFIAGTLWAARLASGGEPIELGDRVQVEAVDGLTLVVRAQPSPAQTTKEGVS